MTGPYRDAAGTACPRCRTVLAPDKRGDLECADGCGTWVARAAIVELVGDVVLRRSSGITYAMYEELPPTPCLRCSKPLEEVCVSSDGHILVFGQCTEHGVWLERGTRDQLERGYTKHIAIFQRERGRFERLRAPGEEGLREIVARIEQLERDKAALEERIAVLEKRVAWHES